MKHQPVEPFGGFEDPNTVNCPKMFFELLPKMSESEMRVMGFLLLKTFGCDKQAETLSLRQFIEGTGLSEPSVISGLKRAEARGSIYQVMLKQNGRDLRLILLNTPSNRRLVDRYSAKTLSDRELLLLAMARPAGAEEVDA